MRVRVTSPRMERRRGVRIGRCGRRTMACAPGRIDCDPRAVRRDRAEREPRLPARAPSELCEGPGRVGPQGRTAADVSPGRRPARPTDQSNL